MKTNRHEQIECPYCAYVVKFESDHIDEDGIVTDFEEFEKDVDRMFDRLFKHIKEKHSEGWL